MKVFGKKEDPISARSKALNAQIAQLENQIKELNTRLPTNPGAPKVRSTAYPQNHQSAPAPDLQPPIFEKVESSGVKKLMEPASSANYYNDQGLRKFDLSSFVRRFQNHLQGPVSNNPKLVNYLAVGSIKGLRPLRYEKRVARNRFLFLSAFFALVLFGILSVIFNRK